MGVGQALPGFAGRDVTFTETRDEIDRLRREVASLFEEAGPSALSGEEYRGLSHGHGQPAGPGT